LNAKPPKTKAIGFWGESGFVLWLLEESVEKYEMKVLREMNRDGAFVLPVELTKTDIKNGTSRPRDCLKG